MTTEQLAALRNLPDASPAMREYTTALALFLIADAPGYHPSPEAWGKANDDKIEAWAALSHQEKEQVRKCAGGIN